MPLINKKTEKKNQAAVVKAGRATKLKFFSKIWVIVYLVALLAFELMLLMLDILPPKYLVKIFLVLALVSLPIALMLSSRKAKKGLRETGIVLAALLMIVFGAGMYYIYGTLSFLGFVSADAHEGNKILDKPFNVYISGIDRWDDISYVGRSDVNMLMTVNPKAHKLTLTSIPRDYKIRLVDHDYASDKLTHTGMMGIETTMSSVEDLLDVKIDYYVRVNFSTLIQLVDALGGIDVKSEEEFTSHYGGDKNEYSFKKGLNHLNGRQALAFARERKSFMLGDRTRVENQQRVVEAVINKMTKDRSTLLKYNSVLRAIKKTMQTDLSSAQIRALVKDQLFAEGGWKMERVSVTGGDGNEATYSGGAAYIMLPDEESIGNAKKKIAETVAASEEKKSR